MRSNCHAEALGEQPVHAGKHARVHAHKMQLNAITMSSSSLVSTVLRASATARAPSSDSLFFACNLSLHCSFEHEDKGAFEFNFDDMWYRYGVKLIPRTSAPGRSK